MSKNSIWRPLNTYGLIFIGACVAGALTYAIVAI